MVRFYLLAALLAATLAPAVALAQESPAPRGSALSVLVGELESLLGRPLNDPERIRCLDAGQRAVSAARATDHEFAHAVADLLGLAPEALATWTPLDVDGVQSVLGRPLSESEREGVRRLEEERALALEPVRAAYARDISAAVGLPKPAVMSVLPRTGL